MPCCTRRRQAASILTSAWNNDPALLLDELRFESDCGENGDSEAGRFTDCLAPDDETSIFSAPFHTPDTSCPRGRNQTGKRLPFPKRNEKKSPVSARFSGRAQLSPCRHFQKTDNHCYTVSVKLYLKKFHPVTNHKNSCQLVPDQANQI